MISNRTWFSFLLIKTRSFMNVGLWCCLKDGERSLIKMGNALQNKVIWFHEKIVFDFLKKIRNYLVANSINFKFYVKNINWWYVPLQPESPVRRRLIFAFHLAACICQLLMFTYSCDCIIQESSSVALAVYDGPWPSLSESAMRKDLTLVILRSGVPCCLTARGFFVVSLETYTRVSEVFLFFQNISRNLIALIKR